tara:strand:- start:735 stop:851 length:117 start_codon:yes stop_codon:yes gene_type:complete
MYFDDLPKADKIAFVTCFVCIALTGLILGLAVALSGVN